MSTRTSVRALTYGAKRYPTMQSNRAAARQAIITAKRQPAYSLPARIPGLQAMVNRTSRRGEMKQVDINQTTVTLNATTTSVTFVNGIAPGTAKYQRVGNKVAPAYVDMQLTALNNSTTTPLFFKYALVWDKQPTGTLPNYSDIYQDVNAAGTSSTSFFAGRNMDTTDRFITIASEDAYMLPTAASSGGKNAIMVRALRSLRGYQQQFKGTDALLGSVGTGALYMVLFANTDGTQTMTVNFDCRYKYTDM